MFLYVNNVVYYAYFKFVSLFIIYLNAGIKLGILKYAGLLSFSLFVYEHRYNADKIAKNILEHLEYGIALLDDSLSIVFANHKFVRLFHTCFGTNQEDILAEYIHNLGTKRRVIFRIDHNKGAQFFMVIKTFIVDNKRGYLVTLNKRRLRKIDLFKILQSEYKISLEQFKIIMYLSKGFNNMEIAQLCNLKPCNVKYHLSSLYNKFYVSNRIELVNKIKDIENNAF